MSAKCQKRTSARSFVGYLEMMISPLWAEFAPVNRLFLTDDGYGLTPG